MKDEIPKFKIGEEAYTVSIHRNFDWAKIERWVVESIVKSDRIFMYILKDRKEEEFSNDYLYTYEEALKVLNTKKRPNL